MGIKVAYVTIVVISSTHDKRSIFRISYEYGYAN